jgi:hypothetical protein
VAESKSIFSTKAYLPIPFNSCEHNMTINIHPSEQDLKNLGKLFDLSSRSESFRRSLAIDPVAAMGRVYQRLGFD